MYLNYQFSASCYMSAFCLLSTSHANILAFSWLGSLLKNIYHCLKLVINSFLRKLLLPLLLCLLIIFFRHGGLLQQYELRLIDYFFQWKPSETIDDRIVMVGITEADIEKLQVNRLSDLYLYNCKRSGEGGRMRVLGKGWGWVSHNRQDLVVARRSWLRRGWIW